MLVCEYDTIIQGSNQCKKSVGGVRKSWGIDWKNVESVQGLAETGTITGLTLKEGKTLKVLEYDNDNTASYNQTTNRVGLDARVEQVATLKFTGANVEKSVIANKAKGVHNGLWFHLQNDGTIHSQGAEFGAKGDKIITSLVGAKVNPNINSNTGEGSSDVTWNIVSTSTDIVPVTMTMEDLDALVGEDTGDSDVGDSDIGDSDGPIYDLPSVMLLPMDGSVLNILWDDGGDPSATRFLLIDINGTDLYLDETQTEIDLGPLLYGMEVTGASTQNWTVSAQILNGSGTDVDTMSILIHTQSWSGGRFVYAVNSTEAYPPSVTGITIIDGAVSELSFDSGIWKRYTLFIKYHRNPTGWDEGEYGSASSNSCDNDSLLFTEANLSTYYCGLEHVIGSPFISVNVYTPLGGLTSTFVGAGLPFTVDGSNLITSINGVACL